MTVNISTDFKPQGIQPGFRYSARVVNNEDPEKLGKVKARVQDLHNDVPDEHLPWARPKGWPQWSGAGSETGSFSVPEVGTQVDLVFPTDSPYYPEYHPYDADQETMLEEAKEDYPHTHVFHRFLTGTVLWYNRLKKKLFWRNVEEFEGENTGNVKITIKKDGTLIVEGNVDITVKGTTHLTCPHTTVDGDLTVNGIVTIR